MRTTATIGDQGGIKMTNRDLFKAICNEACSCAPMSGWTCNFCRELKSKLEKALKVSYRLTRSPYWPRKMKSEKN